MQVMYLHDKLCGRSFNYLLVALFSDPICLPEYQLCLPVSTLAEKEFLGFTIYRHSSRSTDQHRPSHSFPTRPTKNNVYLHQSSSLPPPLQGKKKAISLLPRLPCESSSYSLSSVFSKSAELLICCVSLAVTQQDNVSEKMQ